ncbi:hypothetical protein [Methanolobus profundi]|uniref:Uncharacterized protein n=1 Tax=Methanolobus profundi TaxID=487685 RepID=A0A1I4ST91_9EURY|nr:hypothetical protein [Methanolobus profundi]SFM67625.1 hypothetical protein SAMN04488696_2001 [Methanolobus profundi]
MKEDTFMALVLIGISTSMAIPPYTGRGLFDLAATLFFGILSTLYSIPVLKRWIRESNDSDNYNK